MAENTESEGRYIDPGTGEPKEGPTGSATGRGPKTEEGKHADTEKHGANKPTTDTVDKPDRTGKGNLGGRNPSQPQTAAGDRDSSGNRPDMGLVDPMTSRAPDKINQPHQE